MELPTWFIVFIVLALLALAILIMAIINPTWFRIKFLQNQTNIMSGCREWMDSGCAKDKLTEKIKSEIGCMSYDECLKICQNSNLCW